MNRVSRYVSAAAATAMFLTTGVMAAGSPLAAPEREAAPEAILKFEMKRSTGAANARCLKGAGANVKVEELGGVEEMTVRLHDMPAATPFVLWVIQAPDAPFGNSWYQADLSTDQSGAAKVVVRGRFNNETVTLATGVTDAPQTHGNLDAAANPQFKPVHMYHLGVWFDVPADAVAAGCPSTVTPFNGDHTAGIQALSTRNFPALEGPLGDIG